MQYYLGNIPKWRHSSTIVLGGEGVMGKLGFWVTLSDFFWNINFWVIFQNFEKKSLTYLFGTKEQFNILWTRFWVTFFKKSLTDIFRCIAFFLHVNSTFLNILWRTFWVGFQNFEKKVTHQGGSENFQNEWLLSDFFLIEGRGSRFWKNMSDVI